jgi:3-vinyl bacteriochlorophyllide hydratase
MNASQTARGREVSEDEFHRLGGAERSTAASKEPKSGFSFAKLRDDAIDAIAPSPWGAHSGRHSCASDPMTTSARAPLYTEEERRRRDASYWTIVQGVLAPLQFVAFAVSLGLVIRFLLTGRGYEIATISILIKTILLYTIMITGSIWEKEVFGKWLFARPFFWEDVFSMLVLGLQTAYLGALITGWLSARQQVLIAVAAYAAYIINATQFLLKLRAARLEARRPSATPAQSFGRAA